MQALRHLHDLIEARERFAAPGHEDDGEALHDFRVALRRLRIVLGVYAEHDSSGVRKSDLRKLKKLSRATSEARDAEVFLEWLDKQERSIARRTKSKRSNLARRVEKERARAYARIVRKVLPDTVELLEALSKRLVHFAELRAEHPRAQHELAKETTKRIERELAVLSKKLRLVKNSDDVEAAHAARIAAKHLRYLLEPLADDATLELVELLKAVQDSFGELHDMQFILERLDEFDTAKKELVELLRKHAATRVKLLFARIQKGYLAAQFVTRLRQRIAVALPSVRRRAIRAG